MNLQVFGLRWSGGLGSADRQAGGPVVLIEVRFFGPSGGVADAFYRCVRLFSFSRITSKAKNLLSAEYELA